MLTYYVNKSGYERADEWSPNCWVSLEAPTADERDALMVRLDVPEYFISDIEDYDERPRNEEEDGWHLIVTRIPMRRQDASRIDFTTVPLGILIKGEVCVTICNCQTEMLRDFVNYTIRKRLHIATHYELAMRLLLSSAVWYLKYLKIIKVHLTDVEGNLAQTVSNTDIMRLQRIENSLVYFITSIKGNYLLFSRMTHSRALAQQWDDDLTDDVEIELKQAEETANIYRNIAESMSNSYSSLISNNINGTMKTLTSISLILMFPTLIASLFGMNVVNYLESSPRAFLLIVCGSVVASALMALWFNKKGFF